MATSPALTQIFKFDVFFAITTGRPISKIDKCDIYCNIYLEDYLKSISKPLLYTPDWLVSFERDMAGEIVLDHDPGKIIREYRKKYGISQEELGGLMDMRRESILRIENGSVIPTFVFVKTFIKAMALIEAVRVERAQHRRIDIYFLENIVKESGLSLEKLPFILTVAVQSYDKKVIKIQKSLGEKRHGK